MASPQTAPGEFPIELSHRCDRLQVQFLVGEAFLLTSGRKNEPKPKLLGADIFRWGGGLPREGVGAKKFGMSFATQGNQTFLGGISRDFQFCRNIPGVPEKSENKQRFVFNSRLFFTVELLCLHSIKALLRGNFPVRAKKLPVRAKKLQL